MRDIITVTNEAQRVLMECELKGQISDGHWENSRPYGHWQRPSAAMVLMGDVPSINFESRKYNFTDQALLDAIGQRMISFVKFYSLFPNLSFGDHWVYDLSDGVPSCAGKYWDEKRAKLRRDTGYADLKALVAAVNAVEYSEADLRKDLRGLKAAFSNQV